MQHVIKFFILTIYLSHTLIDERSWCWNSGLQSIPRRVWLDKSGKQLLQWPVEEIETLRDNQVSIHGKKLLSGAVFELSGITAAQVIN